MRKWAKEWGQFVTLLAVVVGATIAMFAWGFGVLRADIARLDAGLRADIARVDAGLQEDVARVDAGLRADIARVESRVLENQREITALVREVSELRGELKGRDLIAGTEDR